MLIPLGTDRPMHRLPVVTIGLIVLNVVVAIGLGVAQGSDPQAAAVVRQWAMLDPTALRPWQLVTYAFLHAGLLHILGNMLFLWIFGPSVEDRYGHLGFVAFYLLGAAAAGLIHTAAQPNPVVGASGAVAAVTGAFLIHFPGTHIRTLLFFIVIGVFMIPAGWFIGARIAWDMFMQGIGAGGPVARWAHLGGYGYGIAVALGLLATGILKKEPGDIAWLLRQGSRRRAFREAARQAKTELRKPAVDDEQSRAVQAARAEVLDALRRLDLPTAAAAYRQLLDRFRHVPGAVLLSRQYQYDLANHYFATADYPTAAVAYELLAQGYPRDSERPIVGVMLGLINARYLNDPIRAKAELNAAMPALHDGQHKQLAEELLAELG